MALISSIKNEQWVKVGLPLVELNLSSSKIQFIYWAIRTKTMLFPALSALLHYLLQLWMMLYFSEALIPIKKNDKEFGSKQP